MSDDPFDSDNVPEDESDEIIDTICAGCDLPARVNDVGLCRDCNAKLERDLIRARDWEYSATAFLTPENQRETLRLDVIRKYGAAYELIEPPSKAELRARKPKPLAPPAQPIEPRAAGTYQEADVLDSLERILTSTEHDQWYELSAVGSTLRQEYPDLNPKAFGYKSLRRLVQAHPQRFHTRWDDPKHRRHAHLYICLAKSDTPQSRP